MAENPTDTNDKVLTAVEPDPTEEATPSLPNQKRKRGRPRKEDRFKKEDRTQPKQVALRVTDEPTRKARLNKVMAKPGYTGKYSDPKTIPPEIDLFGDFRTYCQELLWIRNKKGHVVPFFWNIVQERLHQRLEEESAKGRRLRLILKYRRAGITTYHQAKSFWLTANNEGQSAATLAHDNMSTSKIFNIALLYYKLLVPWATPSRKTENRKELNFDKLGSEFYIGTAGGRSFGRGQTVQRVHGSEVAFWPKSADVPSLVAGIMEAASEGEVDFETTANGHGNWFHKAWLGAKNGENLWVPIFLSWKDDPELSIATSLSLEQLKLSTQEEDLVKQYHLLPGQIVWRRKKMSELYDADRGNSIFYQEYPINDIEAFISSGLCFFDAEAIAHRANFCKPPIQVADSNRLKIWCNPILYHSYAIGADIGEGVAEGNRTIIAVMDTDTCEEVASWAGICSPEDAARKMADLGKLYNTALLCPEANNYGHSTLNTLLNVIGYPHIYQHADYVPVRTQNGDMVTPKYGWQTTPKTRPLMLSEFREAVQGGFYTVNDPLLFSECMTFVDNGHGKYEAAAGNFDDRVFAHAIVWQARKRQIDLTSFDRFVVDTGYRSILSQWEDV